MEENDRSTAHSFRIRRLTLPSKILANAAAIAAATLTGYDEDDTDDENKDKECTTTYGTYSSNNYDNASTEVDTSDAVVVKKSAGTKRQRCSSENHDDEDEDDAERTEEMSSAGVAADHHNASMGVNSTLGQEQDNNNTAASTTVTTTATTVIADNKSTAKSMTHMHMTEAFICRIRSRLLLTKDAFTAPANSTNSTRRLRSTRSTNHNIDEKPPQVFKHDHLSFPRNVVGTFSCHGIEPLYRDFYDEEETEQKGETRSASTMPVAAKINQDRGGVAYPYGNNWHTALFATYDGHGEGGELVSHYAMTEIQKRLECHPDFDSNIEKAFIDTFIKVDEDLEDQHPIEPLYSGTTACVVILRRTTLYIANAGDSRAVLARKIVPASTTSAIDDSCHKNQYVSINLSIDQNPDSPGEQERIESCGGYVSLPPEPGLSARVWLDSDFTNFGLAMARSVGDHALKSVGVISEPVVTKHELIDQDDFMIVATDGVWEFIDSAEAVEIVAKHFCGNEDDDAKEGDFGGATAACKDLIETAAKRWHEHEGDYRDDITAVVVKLKNLWENVISHE